MARTIATTTLAKGSAQTVERRTRRVCIEIDVRGRVHLTAEQEEVTRLNGSPIGGPLPAPAISIGHDDLVANPSFPMVMAAVAGAIDSHAAAIEEAAAKAIADAEAAEPVVITDDADDKA